jgi:C4-dicarboxylate-specific signal transduction histidine kinase
MDIKTINYKKITLRNLLVNLFLFVLPFILLYFIVNHQISSHIKQQIYSHLSDLVEENSKTIQIFFQERSFDLRSLSHLDIAEIEQAKKFQAFFASLIQEKEWFDFIVVSDLQGNITLSINLEVEANISNREYFQEAAKGNTYISDIFYSDILDKPVMIIAHPLRGENEQIMGVLAASLKLENFYSLLFDLTMSETSELFLINEEGLLLSPTKLGGVPLEDKGFDTSYENPHTGENGVKTHYDYRGKKVLCAYKKLPQSNFYLVSEMDLDEAMEPVQQVGQTILFVFILFFLLFVVISVLYSRRITALLRKLTQDLESSLTYIQSKKNEVDRINVELEKKMEEAGSLARELQLSEEYIRNLIDSISLGVIGLDREGKISHLNKEVIHMIEDPDLKPGNELFHIAPWFNAKRIRDTFQATLDDAEPKKIENKSIPLDKGEEYYNFSFFPIKKNGDPDGITLLMENITEKKRLREQLAEYEKLSALSQLALGAAHEINNPLLGISSFLEMKAEESEDTEEKEEVNFVLENVYRISETIRGLLNFARPTPPQFTKININHLIQETLNFLSHQPIFRRIKIKKQLSPSLSQITADLNQIRQVLINMFINAAQSMPSGGELTVATEKVKFKEWIHITISDTGGGIKKENINKIFNPFFTTKKKEGTGLGLSISLSYIKNHNGEINVQSRPGEGTTFIISLPIRQGGRTASQDKDTIS